MPLLKVFRRIRGAASLALLWSIAWMTIGAMLRIALPLEGRYPTVRMLIATIEVWGLLGAIAGAVFAMCIALDSVQVVRFLPKRRGLMWGVLSALVLPIGERLGASVVATPIVSWSILAVLVEFGVAGAICGLSTVALSQRNDSSAPTRMSPSGQGQGLLLARSKLTIVGRRIRDALRLGFGPPTKLGVRSSRAHEAYQIALDAA